MTFPRVSFVRLLGLFVALLGWASGGEVRSEGHLILRDGYFWDPANGGSYFIPRGIAYQTFNPEVGATQSAEQIADDFEAIVNLRANSVRCEFVWSQLEVAEGRHDWSKADRLIAEAERLGLKLFVIIGFQYPPRWFPRDWMGVNDRILTNPNTPTNWMSDVLNYEHPEARRAYSNHVAAVTARYRDSRAIGAWILGNEYAYFDLWEDLNLYKNRRMLGHDRWSAAAFRSYLKERHGGDVERLNRAWRTSYTSFDEIPMPGAYPADRNSPPHFDVYQWRKQSIGDFVALGAAAARANDPEHLITYSMVGGIYNGLDANFTAEDGRTIVERCRRAGVPLDFWSVNNYAWASMGNEMRSADFGIARYRALTGLPVMISETGHSSTENLFDHGRAAERQPRALESQLWEALMSGAAGLHVFTWNDRERFTEDYFLRERGFGIVDARRVPKPDVFARVERFLLRMGSDGVSELWGGSKDPATDIQFFWSDDTDLGWPIANQENAMLWGALKRAGFQPGILGDAEFARGAATNAAALVLSRAFCLRPEWLEAIRRDVLGAGVSIHANADLPGQFNSWHAPNPGWAEFMRGVFGLDVAGAWAGYDAWAVLEGIAGLRFSRKTLAELPTDGIATWKIWHGLRNAGGQTLAWHRGVDGSQPEMPALQLMTHPRAKAVVNTFALGDIDMLDVPAEQEWRFRRGWVNSIYRTLFGLTPPLRVSGAGAEAVFLDYRHTRDGGVLVSFLNGSTNRAQLQVPADQPLLAGRRVESVTRGGWMAEPVSGVYEFEIEPDACEVLLARLPQAADQPAITPPGRQRVWFEEAPGVVLRGGLPVEVVVGVDGTASGSGVWVGLEQVGPVQRTVARIPAVAVAGSTSGRWSARVGVPPAGTASADLPSERGGEYRLRAWVESARRRVAGVSAPIRVLPGIEFDGAPDPVAAGTMNIAVRWAGLPSVVGTEAMEGGWTELLSRTEWWESAKVGQERAVVAVQAESSAGVWAGAQSLTAFGEGREVLTVQLPGGGPGPMRWAAVAYRAASFRSDDFFESFEGYRLGAMNQWLEEDPASPSPIAPWFTFSYGPGPQPVWWEEGVHPEGSHGSQSAFLVYTNPPSSLASGFGIKRMLPSTWVLPAGPRQGEITLSFDFKEAAGLSCVLEMQIANADQPGQPPRILHYLKEYTPGPDGWDTVRAKLSEFVHPEWSPPFDPDAVVAIVCNVQLRRDGVMYVASIDNVRVEGPDEVLALGPVLARHEYGAAGVADTDGDGLADPVETGTGVYRGEEDTGTQAGAWDTDGDGMGDGEEVEAGTDPTRREDSLALGARVVKGEVELWWPVRAGHVYRLEQARVGAVPGVVFEPAAGGLDWWPDADGEVVHRERVDAARLYRLRVRRL